MGEYDYELPPELTGEPSVPDSSMPTSINDRPIGATLDRLVRDTLRPGQRGMIEFDATLNDGVELEFAQRFGNHWTFDAYGRLDKTGREAGIRISGAW